ncbi:MAG: uroporphyrinogen decarboxylase family protein [Anaerolineae bacterium]
MGPKQAILQAFGRVPSDRAPATVFGGGVWTIRHWGTQFGEIIRDPKAYADMIIRTNEELQSPMVYVGSGFNNYLAAAMGGRIKERPLGAPDLDEPIIRKSADELDEYTVEDVANDSVTQNIWEATRLVAEAVGDDVVVTTTAWGPFTLAGQIYGVEDFMRGTYKKKAQVHKTLEFATQLLKAFYRPLVEDKVIPVMSIADPTASGDLISARVFRTFSLPYLQDLIHWGHEHGVATWLHICGDTTEKLDDIAETEADCFSLDYKVNMATAKEKLAGRMCIAGNVDPVAVLDQGTPEDVRRASQACLEAAATGGGFILTAGCDLPPTVPEKNLLAMLEMGG